jgi:hypothetical protein
MADLYLQSPPEDKTYRFVLQNHVRGKSAHLDLRYEFTLKKLLLGWTLAAIKSLKHDPANLKEAKELSKPGMNDFVDICHDPTRKIICIKKAAEPEPWISIDDATFRPGEVGATKTKFGYMWIIDNGEVEYLAIKPHFTEMWYHGTKKWEDRAIFQGRVVIRALPNVWRKRSLATGEPEKTGKGYLVHMLWFPDPDCYVLSKRAVDEKWIPPFEISALPKHVRKQIPDRFGYWKVKSEPERKKLRDKLVQAIRVKELVIDYEKKPGN